MPVSSALQLAGKDNPVLNDETEVAVMKASARIAGVLSGAVLGFGLIAGVAPLAHADGGHRHESGGSGFQRSDVDTSDWPQGKSLSDPDGGQWDKPGHDGGEDDDRDGNNGCGNDTDRSDDNNGHCGRPAAGTEVRGDADDADDDCAVDAEDDDADVAGNHGAEVKSAATARDDDHGATVSAVAKAGHPAQADDDDDADDDDSDCPGTDDTATAAGTTTQLETAAGVSTAADVSTAAGTGATVLGATEVAAADSAAPADTTTAPGTQVLGITETAPSTLARTGAGVGALALAGGLSLGGGRLTALIRRRIGS